MNKRVLAIVVALVLLIGGSIAAVTLTRTSGPDAAAPPVAQAPTLATAAPTPTASTVPAATVTPGVYEDYSDTAIADAQGTTLLFFHAPWCGQCRDLEADILEFGVPDGVTIIKVDFDSRQDVRQQYDVNMRTTFVKLDASGAESERFVAYDTPSLQAVIDALL